MSNSNKLKRNLKMKKSIVALVFVFVLSQLGNAASTIDIVPSITGETELPKPDEQANTINLEDDVEKNKKPVVLLVPVESSEEIYDSHDDDEEDEGEEEESTAEVEDVHHNHKTKRCKSPNSSRISRRIPSAKASRKYISASTESTITESMENPMAGTSLFRVASVKDAKKILKSLLKARPTKREDDGPSERVSKPQKQDSIRPRSKDSHRQGQRPKKYVCYCVEEDCDMRRSGKRPSRTYAAKKKIGANAEDVVGTPNNLRCPPGAILMEEPEYLAQLAMKREKHNYRRRPVKNCPETIFPPDPEAYSLGQPTKIHIPLADNRKSNRRVFKVDRKSPFAQKVQSVFEQKETQDGTPCDEPESTYNDPQTLQGYYDNEQSDYNPYNQIPVAPNLDYPGHYVPYPDYLQYPQYPQYGDGPRDPIPLELPEQDFVNLGEPLHNGYMPTPLGRNFIDINQCIKLFGRNFCIVTTTTISPIPSRNYASDCEDEHEEPGEVPHWREDTRYSTMPQGKTSKYPTSVYNAGEATTHFRGLGVTRHHEENLHRGEKYPGEQYRGRVSSGFEYDRGTTSPYYTEPITPKIQANHGTSRPSNYEIIGSKHEEEDYGDYGNFVDPESPAGHGHTNSEYLVPIEDSYDSESPDYLGNPEETNESNVLQKISEESVTSSHAPEDDAEDATTSLATVNEPEEYTYTSATYSNMNDAEEMKTDEDNLQKIYEDEENNEEVSTTSHYTTESRVGDSVQKYSTTKLHSYLQSKRPESNSGRAAAKTTSSYEKLRGKPALEDNFAEPGFVSSMTADGDNQYSTAYATTLASKYGTTSLSRANEPEEQQFSSTIYPDTDAEETGHDSSGYEMTSLETPSTLYTLQSKNDDEETEIQNNEISDATTSYATMENSKYETTPLPGETEPEEPEFNSYTPYITTIGAEEDAEDAEVISEKIPASTYYTTESEMADMDGNRWSLSEKSTSPRHQFLGITQSSPLSEFTNSVGTRKPPIYYATITNSRYDPTPSSRTSETDEVVFPSNSPYQTTIETNGDTSVSSWLQNAEERHEMSTEKKPSTSHYSTNSEVPKTNGNERTKTGKTKSSHPQFVGVTQSTPINDFSYFGVDSSATIGSENHERNFYATMKSTDHSTTSTLKAEEPEEEIFSTTSYPTTQGHEEIETTYSWPEENEEKQRNNVEVTTWSQYHPTQFKLEETGVDQHFTIDKYVHPQFVKSHQSTNDISSSAGFDTGRYFTTEGYFNPQFSAEVPEDITVTNNDEQSTNWDYSTAQQKATSQSAHRQFVAAHHSTTAPRFKPDSGIKEETNAYFTSKAYDDNINPVTGPDSYFEGGGLKSWDDFTSMSADDFTIGGTNEAEEVKQPTTVESFVPNEERSEATEISTESTMDNEFTSRSPIGDTHFFESHSADPKILKSENKILDTTSMGSLGIDYTTSSKQSTFDDRRFPQPDITKIPFLHQSTTSYERKSDTLDDTTIPEDEADEKALIYGEATSPSEDYDYTNEYSTLSESPTTEFSKYHEDTSLQPLGNTLRNEPSLKQESITTSINYQNNMNSKDDSPGGSSESVTASNLKTYSTTTKSVNYEDFRNSGSTQELEWHPNYIEEQTTPTFDSSEEISSEDQLSPEDRNILRSTVEKVVNDLMSAKSGRPDEDGSTSPEVVGAPMLSGLPELPILKNLFSLPEVRNMAVGTVKGLMSEVSGVPRGSSLGRLTDHLINSILDKIVNSVQPGSVTTSSSAIVDEHRYENGEWTVVPVTLVPKVDRVGEKSEDKVLATTKDIVGRNPEEKVLRTIEDIVGRPGIGLQGARHPLVQNIIVRAVENTLRNAKQVVNHSVIWDTLNDVLARAEESLKPSHGITTTVKAITKSNAVPATKSSSVKIPGGPYKVEPVIPITEHVFKDGKWEEKQTVLGARKKNFESSTSTSFATDIQQHSSPTFFSYETSTEPENFYDYSTKPVDYALLGESEEDGESQEYDSTTDLYGITNETPKNINNVSDAEDGLDNSPIKYYSPNDRILSYIKNHQTPAGFVGSQEKWQPSSGSFSSASTEDYSASTETVSNESTENTDNSAEFAQATQTYDSVGSSEKSTICECAEKKKMNDEEEVASVLRDSTEASTEEINYSELTSTVNDSDGSEKSYSRNDEEEKSLTTLQSPKNSASTEPSEFSSTIHHLDVDQDESNDYTTEEYGTNENPTVAEELPKNTAEESQKKSEGVETLYATTNNIESTSISNSEEHTKNIKNQMTSTPVYVYGEPVGTTEFSEGTSRSEEETVESADEEFIGRANTMTTENIDDTSDKVEDSHEIVDQTSVEAEDSSKIVDQTSKEVEASEKIMDLNETPTVSDVTDKNLGTDNHKDCPCGQDQTTPVYVYGTPVNEIGPQKIPNSIKSTTQRLQQEFSETLKSHDISHDTTTSASPNPEEKIGNSRLPGFETTESRPKPGSDDGHPEEYTKIENPPTTGNFRENFEDEASTEAAKSNESFSDFTSEVLQAESKNFENDFSTRVYGEQIQETTTQLPHQHPKTLKSYVPTQEASTSSRGSIGAARTRNGRPRLPSLPRDDLERPREDILQDSKVQRSNCTSPKYDPTYFGKISLNDVNPGGDNISNLMSSDLFYVGDGVKIPLTIRRMPDGSFALSISEKICENFVKRKCPCCVPGEGDIVEERRQSNEPEEYEASSKEDYNYGSLDGTESAEFPGKSKKRYVRSTSGSEVVVTSATPVDKFVKKYNLTLSLEKNHSPTKIQRNDEDAEELKNRRRKTRLTTSGGTKLRNLYGNNNEIQRDDSEEIENRIVDDSHSDTVSKESNSIRKAEYTFDTDTNDFIQSLLHIRDAPEERRTEIVLQALDGLVNAGEHPDSMDRHTFVGVAPKIRSGDHSPGTGSDEYDLNEMENEMAKYGYQKDNPILERIRYIKAQQNSHGQYKYQKNIDQRAKGKMNMLKTILQWLRQVFLETKSNDKR